ncbi:MAG: non-ribosomal peptide synthetase, partial [bacterium]|nr:non-ribosomal peptide synthetase [bacterium]
MKKPSPSSPPRTPNTAPIREHGPLPLSLHQERLWFLDQLERGNPQFVPLRGNPQFVPLRGNPVYHLAAALDLTGPLDRAAFEDALSELLRRHQVLRTRICGVDGQPVAAIAPTRTLALPLYDLGKLPAAARRAEVRRRALAHARRPFDLERGPLLRAALLRLSEAEHVLLLSFHRLAVDAGSLEVVRRELLEALSRGQRSSLPRQVADVARRQRQWLQGEDCARQLAYWKRQLAGAPALIDLPTDRPRRAVPSYRGARRSLVLPTTLSEQETPLFTLLLAAFKVLLLRTTGQQEIVVGSAVADRGGEEDEALIGPFENPLVLRTDLSGDPEFRQLSERISAVLRTAHEHRDLPFERLVEELQPERDLSRE